MFSVNCADVKPPALSRRHPLQAGVGEDYIEIGVELVERPGVQHIEIAVGVELARRGDHVRGAVDAEDPRLRV